jgi:hypothetical protein
MPSSKLVLPPMPVTTMLTPSERARVDAAAQGLYCALHRESLDEVIADLRERRAGAVLVSISRYGLHSSARMAAMVREFPRVPAMALLTETQYTTPQSLLSLVSSEFGSSSMHVSHPAGKHFVRFSQLNARATCSEQCWGILA